MSEIENNPDVLPPADGSHDPEIAPAPVSNVSDESTGPKRYARKKRKITHFPAVDEGVVDAEPIAAADMAAAEEETIFEIMLSLGCTNSRYKEFETLFSTLLFLCSGLMGSRFPSHQLSSGLYVSGRPEQPKERTPTMGSTAMPYTGGDIKRSGELGKMFDIPTDGSKSRKSGPISGPPSRTGSFAGAVSSVGLSGATSLKKTNSGPLNKHGEPIKRTSGPQSGGVTPIARQNSGPIPPVLPTTGLITSGPISSGPLNSSGAPRKFSGPLESMGSVKLHSSLVHNQAVTKLNQDEDYSFRRSFPKSILWAMILLFVMGFIAGGFILGAVHNAILLIVVVILFAMVAALFTWNSCSGRKAIVGFIARYPDAELRTAKNGQYVKVSGATIRQMTDGSNDNYCSYTSDIATGLGVASLLFLLASQIIIMVASRCLCFGRGLRPGSSRNLAIVLFITCWVAFIIAEICLLAGSVRNAYHTKYRTRLATDLSCERLRRGVFGAAAAFIVLTGILSEVYYVNYAKSHDSSLPPPRDTGIRMGSY